MKTVVFPMLSGADVFIFIYSNPKASISISFKLSNPSRSIFLFVLVKYCILI